MHERVRQEIELLRKKYPSLEHGQQLDWVLIPEFELPPNRFKEDKTRLLFVIPVGYPNTGPDNFFVDMDLHLQNGGTLPGFNPNSNSSNGAAPVPGNWGWFSWHPQTWRPAASIDSGDNLLTFVRGVNLCLRGEESA